MKIFRIILLKVSASTDPKTRLYEKVSVSESEWSDCSTSSRTVDSLAVCGVLCQKSEFCFGFHFDENLKECKMVDYWLDTFTSTPALDIYRSKDTG